MNDRSLDISDVIRDIVERCREDPDERPVLTVWLRRGSN